MKKKLILTVLFCGLTGILTAKSGLFTQWTDFFKITTGVAEKDFRQYPFSKKKDFYYKKVWPFAGAYHEYTIKELRAKNEQQKPLQGKGDFKVLYKTIQEIFADSSFDKAVIQSASDLTGLEGFLHIYSEHLNFMQNRAEQGETVAACTLYGNIYRKYFKKSTNFLNEIKGLQVQGQEIIDVPNVFNEKDFLNFKVGYQKDTKVTFEAHKTLKTQKNKKFPALTKKISDMRVDQAISFGLNMYSPNIQKLIKKYGQNHLSLIGKQIIRSTYEGVIRAAFYNRRKKVVLTLVGAGVYGNPKEWALGAIKDMMPFALKNNMEIYLVLPSKKNHEKDIEKFFGKGEESLEKDIGELFPKEKIYKTAEELKKEEEKVSKGLLEKVKRVGVVLYTEHPEKKGERIMFLSSAKNPNFAPEGYTSCFPGIARNPKETWEYNAAKGFNYKTYFYFARMFDTKEELFYYRLYSKDSNVRKKYQEKAHKIIEEKLKECKYYNVNYNSRLFFLYIPNKDFETKLRAQLVHNEHEKLLKRFGNVIEAHDPSIRPGKYFNWVMFPEHTTGKLVPAFRKGWLTMSPFALGW